MRKRYFLIFFIISSHHILAQDWLGFHSSNYAGVQGISNQPASIADSRYKFQMNLIGASAGGSTNYYSLPNKDFKNFEFDFDSLITSAKTNDKGAFQYGEVYAPLSFMLTMSPKHALALTVRGRAVTNIDRINADLAGLIDAAIEEEETIIEAGDSFDFTNFYAQTHAWAEFGLTYARVIIDDNERFLKGGATFKYLKGIGSGYTHFSEFRFDGVQDDVIDVSGIDVHSGLSAHLFDEDEDLDYTSLGTFPSSVGLDLGVVYEHRPDMEKYHYEMDGNTGLIRRDKNKYKYRIGFSILDIGGIKYNRHNDTGRITGTAEQWDLNSDDDEDLDETLERLFTFERGGTYRMSLPTRILADFDYHVAGGLYMNMTTQLGLKGGLSDKEKSRYLTTVSLTPRFEGKNFGLAVPVSYDKMANANAGISLRLGFLIVGSRDIVSNYLLGKDPKSIDAHVALRFGLPYRKKRDKDKDGVSNKKDQCKRVPGVWAFQGCPDRDGDGVQDSEDICPDVKGLPEFLGCPDMDGDGVEDKKDTCPEVSGLKEFDGCPDTDQDGVQDSEDRCPEVAGVEGLQGCPDTDADGIEDSKDECPELAGMAATNGCPDTDGDGLFDNKDDCPEVSGPAENGGCPYTDTDGDGVIDQQDDCINTPGTVANNGCPELEEEEQEILNTAFSNLEFETGSSKIALSSYSSLVELANLLKLKPEWGLKISGHTDNTGNQQKNQILSEQRAQAVAEFMVAQGLEEERFTAQGFGQDQPIADNSTREGRKQNRRVELEVIFE